MTPPRNLETISRIAWGLCHSLSTNWLSLFPSPLRQCVHSGNSNRRLPFQSSRGLLRVERGGTTPPLVPEVAATRGHEVLGSAPVASGASSLPCQSRGPVPRPFVVHVAPSCSRRQKSCVRAGTTCPYTAEVSTLAVVMESRAFVCSTNVATSKLRTQSLITPDVDYLLVCPSRDRFNDFGTVSHVDMFVVQAGGISAALSGKLLVADQDSGLVERNTSDFLRKKLNEVSDTVLPLHRVLENCRFLSVLVDSDEYKKLIDLVGRGDVTEILRQVHDVGYLLGTQPMQEDLLWFQIKPEYGQSLLRSDATFLAVFDLPDQLGAIRPPNERPEKIKLATNLIVRGEIEFSFVADALGASNVNVLVGVNGVGKSRLLRELAYASEQSGPTLFIPSPLDDVDALPVDTRAKIREHPATASGWAYMTSSLALITRDPDDAQYRTLRRAISGFLDLDEVALPLIQDQRSADFSTHTIGGRSFAQLRGASTAFEGRKTEFFGLVDYRSAPVFLSDGRYRHLSSGERALLGMAATLIRDIPERGLVLLDEPELSLHPKMIADLMRLLGLLLRARGAHCIIATHSLFVVRETPDAAVHVLKRSEIEAGGVSDFEPMIQTLGAGLTELSNVIFDDWNIKEYFQQRIEEYLEKPRSNEELSRARGQLGEAARAVMLDLTRSRAV